MIEADDFEAWRENPITQAVMKMLFEEAETCKGAWLSHSWDGGEADGRILSELRGRAHVCEMVRNLKVEDLQDDE